MADVHDLVPLDAWRQEQPAQQEAVLGAVLREDQLYAIDGGVFRAKRDEDGRWVLHTWMGKAGYEVTRTGFEVDADGGLYDRLWDYMAEEALVVTGLLRYTVQDLVPVTLEQKSSVGSTMTVDEFAAQHPELYDAVRDEIERGNVNRRWG